MNDFSATTLHTYKNLCEPVYIYSLIPLLVIFFPEEFIGQTSDDFEIKKTGKSLSKIFTKEEHLRHETMSSGIQANAGRMYFANNPSLMQFNG